MSHQQQEKKVDYTLIHFVLSRMILCQLNKFSQLLDTVKSETSVLTAYSFNPC